MKSRIALLSSALVALVAAQPHHHGHQHQRRFPDVAVTDDTVTVIVYELDGQVISQSDVMQGIRNGTLKWADGNIQLQSSSTSSTVSLTTSASAPPTTATSSSVAPTTTSPSTTTAAAPTTTSAVPTTISAAAPTIASSAATSSSTGTSNSSSFSGSSSGVGTSFPDGTIACSDFPSAYGAIAVDYIGLGGWIGIQSPGSVAESGFSDIETITTSTCSSGGCCADGMYCSYACPAGYQKSQWPTMQGSTGQSVGGLLCKGGMLYKTNSAQDSICMTGSTAVTVQVRNDMSQSAAVCRTDYPGTESETVPLNIDAGSSEALTCPDSSDYYTWKGGSTSAQYYVNPAGVDVSDACQWGSSENDWGNYAPLNLGVGYSDGAAWLAMFPNEPTTSATLDYTVTIEGDGSNLSGTCRYSNGQYCSGTDYETCNSSGCTVSATTGTVTFVFSSS